MAEPAQSSQSDMPPAGAIYGGVITPSGTMPAEAKAATDTTDAADGPPPGAIYGGPIQSAKPSILDTDIIPALKGSAKGIATGLGIPQTDHPISDFGKALNEQVNRIATYPWAKGGPLYGVISTAGHGAWSSGKSVLESLKEMYEASKTNDVEGFYKAVGSGVTNAMLLKGLTNTEIEPQTLGMEKGGLTAQIEKIANRIPISSIPLKNVYSEVADRFRNLVADSVKSASGVPANPDDLVGSLNTGADTIKSQARAAYAPVDRYIAANQAGYVQKSLRQIMAVDPEIAREVPPNFIDHPINALKIVRDNLNRKIGTLINTGKGSEAHGYITHLADVDTVLENITKPGALPPDIMASYNLGQSLWGKQAAMRDIADTFDKTIGGLTPTKQPSGMAKMPQSIAGSSLVDALKDEPQLKRAFGNDVADAIIQHAHRLSISQSLQGGGNAGGMIAGLYGTSLLARAFTGTGLSTIPIELTGIYGLSKVLSNPQSFPAYANMLRATSTTAQDYWARQALNSAIPNLKYGHGNIIQPSSTNQPSMDDIIHHESALSTSDTSLLRHYLGGINHDDLRADINESLHENGR